MPSTMFATTTQNGERCPTSSNLAQNSGYEGEDCVPTSPYTTRAVTVSIGPAGAKYTVLQAIVDQYPSLKERINPRKLDSPIELPDIDEDVGHTLIHYLYTHQYQILGVDSLPDDERIPTEVKLSVLAYCAAKLCGIDELEALSKTKVEELSKHLSIFDIQRVTEEVAGKLPRHGDWFSTQVDAWVKAALMSDDALLSDNRIVDPIGRNAVFDKALVKCLTEMYFDLKSKLKQAPFGWSKARLEDEQIPVYAKTSGNAAMRMRPEPDTPTEIVTQGLQTHVSTATSPVERLSHGPQNTKQQAHQDGQGKVRHDSVVSRDPDTTLPSKPNRREYSPILSEPSSIEVVSPSAEKKEKLAAQLEDLARNTDSEDEMPSKLPVSKKSKKKKGKKTDN